ncbi:hypothetical protein [Halorubellus sp. PRR65]|uniref:hypothetical protein n=1 Tax=Halorubellus sp. PRR65 TaxID=3098148 RepID=UPI002B261687|nr:hypothetical protein [Halorubellus sp. PRR65]
MRPPNPRLTLLLAGLAVVSLVAAVPLSAPGHLGYGCGGPQGADLDRTDAGQWLVLQGGEYRDGEPLVVARYGADWRRLARHELELPANATADDDAVHPVSLTPSKPEGGGFWVVTNDDRAYRYDRTGEFTGDVNPARAVREGGDPGVDSAPADAIDWEVEGYGDTVDAEATASESDVARNYVLARDGTVLAYTSNWQYTGVTHEGVDGNDCFGERPAWPSAFELLAATTAFGLVGLALTSWVAREDLASAAALAVGGPVVAGTFSMYLLPDVASAVYRLPDVALGVGLLAPVAWAAWRTREDPVVAFPALVLSGSALVAAGVRYLLASGLP